jgi:hypothetical protein
MCWPLWNICVTNDHGYVPLVINTSRSFPHSWLITGFVTRLTRRMPLMEQKLPTLPEHLSSPQILSRVCVIRSLVLYVCFVDRCFPFCTFYFGHCVVCSSIYGFWIPLWYLQTLLTQMIIYIWEFYFIYRTVLMSQKALYAVYYNIKNLWLPIDLQLKIVYSLVVPISLYGCEILGVGRRDCRYQRGNQNP